MPSVEVTAFVRANLPTPPARVLEVGAGNGELARLLVSAGYDVVAIDPNASAENVVPVALAELDEPPASFDAAVAIVSLHHVHPLETSCECLAQLLRPGATLLVDEFDVDAFDVREASWWLDRRRELGASEGRRPEEVVGELRAELHPFAVVEAALSPGFDLAPPIRGSYLYRWGLDERLRSAEDGLIAGGLLSAVGVRSSGARRAGA